MSTVTVQRGDILCIITRLYLGIYWYFWDCQSCSKLAKYCVVDLPIDPKTTLLGP